MDKKVRFDAFLSYNSKDKAQVEKIAEWLKNQGICVWFDKWQLQPGIPWQEKLEHGILNSNFLVVFIGQSGIGPWEEPEMRVAIDESVRRKCSVIPVFLPGCPSSYELPLFLKGRTWIDFRNELDNKDEKIRLLWGIIGENPYSNNGSPGQKERGLKKKEIATNDILKGELCNNDSVEHTSKYGKAASTIRVQVENSFISLEVKRTTLILLIINETERPVINIVVNVNIETPAILTINPERQEIDKLEADDIVFGDNLINYHDWQYGQGQRSLVE